MLDGLRAAAGQAEAAAVEAHARAASSARTKCEVVAAEKASLEHALAEAAQQAQRAQRAQQEAEQGRSAVERELAAARQHAEEAEAAAVSLQQQLATARAELAAAQARAAAASAAAESAQQQSQLLAQQQRAQASSSPSSALPSLDPLPPQLGPPTTAASAAHASQGPPPLFGTHFSMWGAGAGSVGSSSSGGGSLFGNGRLDGPAPGVAPLAAGPHQLLCTSSMSMGSSSGPPSSPLSHSGTATPQHSMHSSSIANSPVALPASLTLLGGSISGGGGLFGGLPGGPLSSAAAAGDPLFPGSSGSSGILLPDPNSIWGAPPGAAGAGGSTERMTLFAQQN